MRLTRPLAALLVLATAATAHAQFTIPSSTIDSAGGRLTGGTFTLDGAAGQPDATRASQLAGGTFTLTGGYFIPGFCAADFDQNGTRSIDDIFIFLSAWFAGCTGQAGSPCNGLSADVDGQNGRTIDDIFIFLNLWFAGCP